MFLISQPKDLWIVDTQKNGLNETVFGSFERPKHVFKLMGKKIITVLRYFFLTS